jgi:2,4-dienoyl-CoA reductase-like NADH-dependent reductase (Old Yellow Enzyme family)
VSAPLPALFEPFRVRGVTFRNRVVVSPMCQYSAADGHANDWHYAHHGRFALSGVGGAVVEASGVTANGRITPGCLGIWDDAHVPGLRKIVEIYHAQRIPVGIQLAHAGRKASAAVPLEGAKPLAISHPALQWQTVGPSAIAPMDGWPTPRALTANDVAEVVAAFAAAARRARAAGFDFVEIHGAHGYLIHSFLAPLANRRTDEWGGDFAGRTRLALAITDAVRAALQDDMPLFYRTSAVDDVDGGVTLHDTLVLARELSTRGVDCIDCSSGGITGPSGRARVPLAPGYLVPYARAVHVDAGIATMATGLITTPELANRIVAEGSAQLLAIGRQLLAEPSFAYRAALELGHPEPHDVLPPAYALFLKRRQLS